MLHSHDLDQSLFRWSYLLAFRHKHEQIFSSVRIEVITAGKHELDYLLVQMLIKTKPFCMLLLLSCPLTAAWLERSVDFLDR